MERKDVGGSHFLALNDESCLEGLPYPYFQPGSTGVDVVGQGLYANTLCILQT